MRARAACLVALVASGVAAAAASAADCRLHWRVAGGVADPRGTHLACRDGDPACDADGAADGGCAVSLALCLGGASCPAAPAGAIRVRGGEAARRVAGALGGLAAPGAGEETCTAPAAVRLALGRHRRRRTTLRAVAARGAGRVAPARLRLACVRPARRAAARATAVVVTTDFETGVLATARVAPPHAVVRRPDVPIHADAVVRVADRVYVVNRFLGDNIQILDPARGFATVLQCSTGAGSNPHDLLLAGPRKAYVTRYDEKALWVVDPRAKDCTRFFRRAIDLSPYGDADGLPEMDQMALVGDRLFVSLERLDRNRRFAPAGRSALVVVDTTTDAVVGTVELSGANAFGDASGLVREPGTGKLVVAEAGDIFATGDGGLERVDPETLRAEGFFVTEDALGGNVTDFVLVSPTQGFAIVFVATNPPRNVLVEFDPSRGTLRRRLLTSVYNLPDVALAPDGTLWLADQTLPAPGIRIFDPQTARQLAAGPVDVGLPPFSIGFLP
ncbi:MAG TPA: hypothetical protein VFD84_06470 [Candidatus Binatia bacterium]|nr:hypothetical protein [Candidatus Binatia bacterium]